MKLLKLSFIIGVVIIMNMSGFAFGGNKVLVLELLSRHNAEYWFSDKMSVEFCHAIEWSDTKKIDKMLNEGLEINRQGKQGMTFIAYAYLKDKKKSYEYLLEHGANPNLTLITEEKIEGDVSPFKFEYSTLTMAAEDSEDPFYLDLGLKHGGNPNAIVDDVHILHNAIRVESLTNVQLLVEAGASLNGLTNEHYGGDFLDHAISDGQHVIAYYLLQKGANPELNKDDIILSMQHFIGSIGKFKIQKEYKEKVKKILEDRGFDFSPENIERIRAKKAEALRKWQEEMKKKEKEKETNN